MIDLAAIKKLATDYDDAMRDGNEREAHYARRELTYHTPRLAAWIERAAPLLEECRQLQSYQEGGVGEWHQLAELQERMGQILAELRREG